MRAVYKITKYKLMNREKIYKILFVWIDKNKNVEIKKKNKQTITRKIYLIEIFNCS